MAARMLKAKIDEKAIIANLYRQGLDAYYAEMILENVKADVEDRRQFRMHVLGGGYIFLAGLMLTLGTYLIARPGHSYLVFVGIMTIGIMSITRGFILFRK
jgi:hypothetical protein